MTGLDRCVRYVNSKGRWYNTQNWGCDIRKLLRVADGRAEAGHHAGFVRRFQAGTPRGGWRTNSASSSATSGRAM
jgi:hypothetical protein